MIRKTLKMVFVLTAFIIVHMSCGKEDTLDPNSLIGIWSVEKADPRMPIYTSGDFLLNVGDKVEIILDSQGSSDKYFRMYVYRAGEKSAHNDWLFMYQCCIEDPGFVVLFSNGSYHYQIMALSKQRLDFKSLSDQRIFKLKRI